MVKIWSGFGKRTAKGSAVRINPKSRIQAEPSPQHSTRQSQNVIDFETLAHMVNEYKSLESRTPVSVGDDISVSNYASKSRNLKFLTL